MERQRRKAKKQRVLVKASDCRIIKGLGSGEWAMGGVRGIGVCPVS